MTNTKFIAKTIWGKEFEFDFSGKKVRCNGRVLDKYSLCSHMEDVNSKKFGLYTIYAYDICTYYQLKDEFLQYCVENCTPIDAEVAETAKESAEVQDIENFCDWANNDKEDEFVDDAEVANEGADDHTQTANKKVVQIGICLEVEFAEGVDIAEVANEFARQYSNWGFECVSYKGVQGVVNAKVCDLGVGIEKA